MSDFKVVEKKNHLAVHGLFTRWVSAQRHIDEVIPEYVAKSYFMDKTLKASDFEVIGPDGIRAKHFSEQPKQSK